MSDPIGGGEQAIESALECLDGLTLKQTRFVLAYLGPANGNATQAAKIAGYSIPWQAGYETLNSPLVSSVIKRYVSERVMTADECLMRIARIARGSVGEVIEVVGKRQFLLDLERAEETGAIDLIEELQHLEGGGVKFKLYSKLKALELIGKHLRLFVEKVEHSGKIEVGGFEGWTDQELEEFALTGKAPTPALTSGPVIDVEAEVQ